MLQDKKKVSLLPLGNKSHPKNKPLQKPVLGSGSTTAEQNSTGVEEEEEKKESFVGHHEKSTSSHQKHEGSSQFVASLIPYINTP